VYIFVACRHATQRRNCANFVFCAAEENVPAQTKRPMICESVVRVRTVSAKVMTLQTIIVGCGSRAGKAHFSLVDVEIVFSGQRFALDDDDDDDVLSRGNCTTTGISGTLLTLLREKK